MADARRRSPDGRGRIGSRTRRLLVLALRGLLNDFVRSNTHWLAGLSSQAIPVALGALMLLAVFVWDSDTAYKQPPDLQFNALAFVPDDGQLEPGAARETLRKAPGFTVFDTKLSEAPVWFAFTPPTLPTDASGPPVLYFPSRHARTLACWQGAALQPLGSASRAGASGSLILVNSGFATQAIDLSGVPVICRATAVGPARLTVSAWKAAEFDLATRAFANDMGMLEGGLTVLAIFMLLAAAVTRQTVFVAFAGWLVVSMRVAAISAGWDTLWFGHQVPPDWLDGMRKFVLSSNFALTAFLFIRLFQGDIERARMRPLRHALEMLYIPMFAAALLVPYRYFIPMLWVASTIGYGIIVFYLGSILLVSRSRIAMWFSASLVVTALAGFSEIIKAMFGIHGSFAYINSVTAALSAALLVAMALAEQMRIEREAREGAENALQKTYDQIPVAFFTADLAGRLLRGNPALGSLLGAKALLGQASWSDYFESGSWETLTEGLAEGGRTQLRFQSHDHGAWYNARASKGDGLIEGSIEDVTESVSANRKLMYLADHDQLTGTLSRRAIEQALRGAIQTAAPRSPIALAYMDLDRFKTVNDLYGHTAGDEVLRQLCDRMTKALGTEHLLGRIGGDEFLILLRGLSLPEATQKCHELADLVDAAPFRVHDLAFRIGISFGAVEVTPGVEVVNLIAAADRACREAKREANSDHVIGYGADSVAFQEQEEERALVTLLTPERAPEFLAIAMQPIMSLQDPHAGLDFEVLLRARAADGRVLPAGRVISVAESHGRVGVIDRWVLSTVLSWLDAHLPELPRTRFVTVNFSGASINDERFMADAYAMLRAHPRAAAKICAEITEGVALRDFDQTRRVLDNLREFDVKLALDDFGAGYTSFMYLSDLRADVLKIDGAIVESAARHPSRLSIVQAIADLSRNLGMRSIAEWVEDAASLRAMADAGIDYVQGFAIARPVPPHEILLAPHAAHWIEDATVRSTLTEIGKDRARADDGSPYSQGKNLH